MFEEAKYACFAERMLAFKQDIGRLCPSRAKLTVLADWAAQFFYLLLDSNEGLWQGSDGYQLLAKQNVIIKFGFIF